MTSLSEHIPPYLARWRRLKDRIATVSITAGGAAVLVAILLIFFYLMYEVLPLFQGASVEPSPGVDWRFDGEPAYLAMEEQGEIAFVIEADGRSHFIQVADGTELGSAELSLDGSPATAIGPEGAESRLLALGHASGAVSLISHEYRLSYPGGTRVITPRIERPYAQYDLSLGQGRIEKLAVIDGDDALILAGVIEGSGLAVVRYNKEEDFLSGELALEREELRMPPLPAETAAVYLGADQNWLYWLDSMGDYVLVDLGNTEQGVQRVADRGNLFRNGGELTTSGMLLGGLSLLSTSSSGELVQHFVVRDESGHRLQRIRGFDTDGTVVTGLLPEHRRKGFIALGDGGELQIFHTTAHRRLFNERLLDDGPVASAAISPRGNSIVALQTGGAVKHWQVHNEHPDISWSALWDKVWYESYDQPDYTWQSSSSSNDFEPKYSFAPLAFGTLKAAFYTMLIAAPLAICGAIYTAYFMAPALRRKVKPLIELMEALPTVILGFLAGLWLAPFIEDKLTGVISLLLIMPIGILLFSFLWAHLPVGLRTRVPDGWHAALLVPVVILLAWLSFATNDLVELWLFGGDMRVWITNEVGISFDQRNSLVVGIAMGMAVIPTIFSIAEDAIFSVPQHLSYGSLALGATPWQTLVGVVLPTASPGIFSGLMIGLGRAVGETMIVLMATGNTPIMDANIFEGMRTLSANIAVEVPEAEVDSTHYRVLFLAAFVLFLFTFGVNTVAELVRQRLRLKYGSL